MTRSTLLLLPALSCALLSTSGCADKCRTDKDCPDGSACVDGSCMTIAGGDEDPATQGPRLCSGNDGCEANELCQNGVCVDVSEIDQPLICSRQSDCPGSLFCDMNRRECVECLMDDHCSDPSEICLPSGFCGQADTCSGDPDCSGDLHCYLGGQTGVCVECFSDDHCSGDWVCDMDSFTCRQADPNQGCTPESCSAIGKVCDANSGQCRDCQGNEECPNGLVCGDGTCQPCSEQYPCSDPLVCDFEVTPHICVNPAGTQDLALGETCTSSTQCASGLCLVPEAGLAFCSRPCIGSGKGNDADCPRGFACWVGIFGTIYDGLRFCAPAEELVEAPGYPYDLLPGENCSANSGCQTDLCDTAAGSCARYCDADRDCYNQEVCWAQDSMSAQFFIPTGYTYCATSDAGLLSPGMPCSDSNQCDSGICAGICTDSYGMTSNLCTSNAFCDVTHACQGTCVAHCRSTSDCSPGQICTSWPLFPENEQPVWDGFMWSTVCLDQAEPAAPNLPLGSACTVPGDCESEYCEQGVCTAPCVVDSDCTGNPAGDECVLRKVMSAPQQLLYVVGMCGTRCRDDADCSDAPAGTSCQTASGLSAACGSDLP